MQEVALEVDGTRLYGQWHGHKSPKAVLVWVHGFNSSLLEFGDAPARMATKGYPGLAIDLRGYGLSGGERGLIDATRASKDIHAAATEARARCHAPLVLVGHSLGGALALAYLAGSGTADAAVVAHPVDRLVDELDPVSRRAYAAIGKLGVWRERRGKRPGMLRRIPNYNHLFVDKQAAKEARDDAFLQRAVNIATYPFAASMRAQTWASQVHVPVLCIGSDHDIVVRPEHSRHVFAALAGATTHVRHQGGHSCFRDVDGPLIEQAMTDFLETLL